jgi:hypothetical protein
MVNNSIINSSGKDIVFDRAFRTTPTYSIPSTIKIGRNQSDVTLATTILNNLIPITGTETVDDCEATTGWTADADTAVALNSTTFKIGSNALNFTKTGTTLSTATLYKTTTSVDFTDKNLHSWIYIDTDEVSLAASGTAVEIRFGSDSSNYYYKQYTAVEYAALQNGNWADLYFDSTDSTGSPVITACDYYELILTLTATSEVWTAGSVILDDLKVASTDDYILSQDTNYPVYDTTNREITRQFTLLTTYANGYNVDGILEENTDSTKKSYSVTKQNDASKSSSDQFIFTISDRII